MVLIPLSVKKKKTSKETERNYLYAKRTRRERSQIFPPGMNQVSAIFLHSRDFFPPLFFFLTSCNIFRSLYTFFATQNLHNWGLKNQVITISMHPNILIKLIF